ncbi:hypothetical protein Ahy_A09g043416 [Arachis hypogaea]|uniref:Aminotransferase-like plant mobile domain-containing protein n=1 Tax=Arachis hypogaea TaxID=3818 RepID=A0A445BI67_ARAHY|nr:hypothetical protein Ahy_A09g043416 [Arachis hypogaea]
MDLSIRDMLRGIYKTTAAEISWIEVIKNITSHEAGFGHIVELRNFMFNNSLISAFVERWRLREPETRSFHFPWNVAYHLGLRIEVSQLEVVPETFGNTMDTPCESGMRIYLVLGRHHNQREGSREFIFTDKSATLVSLKQLLLLVDFDRCRQLSSGSALLAHTYHSLCTVARHNVTDITRCMPLVVSWIYYRFPSFCPLEYNVIRLAGLGQQSRDRHDGRIQTVHRRINSLAFDQIRYSEEIAREQ